MQRFNIFCLAMEDLVIGLTMIPDEERLQNIYICTHCVVACVPSSCIQYGSVLHMRFHNRQEKEL